MKNYHKIVLGLIILLVVSIFIIKKMTKFSSNQTQICHQNQCLQIEIADSLEERTRGLMHRTELADNQGMLFIFDQPDYHAFWMKNTLIGLDIIWLDNDLKVVWIESSAQPCQNDQCPTFTPKKSAKYVLEINAGMSDKFDIKIGSQLQFK